MTFSLLKMYFFTVPTQALHVILSVLAMKGKSPVHTPCPSPCLLPSLPPGCEGSQSSPWFRPPTRNVLERLCGTEFAEERQQAIFHVNSTGIFGGQRASRLCGQGEKAGPVLGRSGAWGIEESWSWASVCPLHGEHLNTAPQAGTGIAQALRDPLRFVGN